MPPPPLRTTTLAVGLTLAVVIAAWEFIGLRLVDSDRPLSALESPPVPWGGLAGREAARLLEGRWRLNPAGAAAPLLHQLGHYPLDPWRWLLYSRIQWANGIGAEQLRDNLAAAISVQPKSREVRWQAANLAQSTDNAELVLDQLAQWLADEPRDTARAVFIAGRWADGPGALLDRVVPDDEDFLAQAMEYAYRSHNVSLAQAVWQRLDQPRAPDDEAFADYVTTALNNRRPDLAMQAWQRVDPGYTPGDIPVGDFSVSLEAMPTFGWNLRMPEGATVEREEIRAPESEDRGPTSNDVGRGRTPDGQDPHDPHPDRGKAAHLTQGAPNQPTSQPTNKPAHKAQALRITFSGEHNVHLATPFVRFPIPDPGHYRLTGWWRAQALTTRSLPYVQLYSESGENPLSETVTVPGQAFEWQRFEIPFEVRQPNEILRFRLRRNRTEAFDRYIEGAVWLAGLRVEEVELGTERGDGEF